VTPHSPKPIKSPTEKR